MLEHICKKVLDRFPSKDPQMLKLACFKNKQESCERIRVFSNKNSLLGEFPPPSICKKGVLAGYGNVVNYFRNVCRRYVNRG